MKIEQITIFDIFRQDYLKMKSYYHVWKNWGGEGNHRNMYAFVVQYSDYTVIWRTYCTYVFKRTFKDKSQSDKHYDEILSKIKEENRNREWYEIDEFDLPNLFEYESGKFSEYEYVKDRSSISFQDYSKEDKLIYLNEKLRYLKRFIDREEQGDFKAPIYYRYLEEYEETLQKIKELEMRGDTY